MRLSPSTPHHQSTFLDDHDLCPFYSPVRSDVLDTDYIRFSTTFSSSVINDTSLPFTGQWSFQNNSSLSPLDDTYHTTTNAGDFVNYNFSGTLCFAPSDQLSDRPSSPLGTAVSVFGFRSATSGNYSVQLDNDTVTLNGASSSEVATTLFFRTGLNNSFHTLTITNVDNSLLAIGSINVTTASSQL